MGLLLVLALMFGGPGFAVHALWLFVERRHVESAAPASD